MYLQGHNLKTLTQNKPLLISTFWFPASFGGQQKQKTSRYFAKNNLNVYLHQISLAPHFSLHLPRQNYVFLG